MGSFRSFLSNSPHSLSPPPSSHLPLPFTPRFLLSLSLPSHPFSSPKFSHGSLGEAVSSYSGVRGTHPAATAFYSFQAKVKSRSNCYLKFNGSMCEVSKSTNLVKTNEIPISSIQRIRYAKIYCAQPVHKPDRPGITKFTKCEKYTSK